MFGRFLYGTASMLCAALTSGKAFAFAIFAVPFATPVTPGQVIDLTVSNTAVPAAFGDGRPLTWKTTSVGVTLAFAPNPPGPLSNGTTTWNQNGFSTIAEWNAVGANFAFAGSSGAGNPCVTDGTVVAAFHPSVCLGVLPSLALGISRIVAIVDSPSSIRIADADIAIITPNTASASGAMITDAFDGPITFPNFDFRRIMLHELGHSLGLAHPDNVFGTNPFTFNTVMHSQSVRQNLSADDKNGALALYPVPSSGGSGGGGNALVLAVFMALVILGRHLWRRVA